MRLRMDFGYDGSDFSGWAAQPGLRTVEETLAQAWGTILRQDAPRLTVAGRTDAGVHARGAVCHLDLDDASYEGLPARSPRTSADAAVRRLNGVLPRDVVVRRVQRAPEGFDARFSATSRRYSYRICDDPATLDPVRRRDTVLVKHPVDVGLMDAAARNLAGLNDFAAFCKRREGATTVRTLLDYRWVREEDGTVAATVLADAFCHSMVRSLVGVVLPVGEGRREVQWPTQVLRERGRHPAVTVMPPHGLCLEEVTYPPDDELAARATQSRRTRDPI
ncbi:tRNA pseudouridine(38-40) synthase TruA [Allobranchiibius sp. GilTou73]|uniref:tRNA pseudouridine(38-40) synthase TruA n=1 Tax=Allobranchiibius sp. GilTou73 TaxID=2904523 RepID=UPI001F2C4BCD|nr:tRNA pseudouridine(38-40) synthase TruA [Allobranchiibius sp. GilTou73]UIJ36519.1 tRNA pseudouridine(38-40) synthase TruA [Allobranchiibius sp. GilTou73]